MDLGAGKQLDVSVLKLNKECIAQIINLAVVSFAVRKATI